MPTATALAARDVRVTFDGQPAVDGLSLTAPTGRVTALLGPNGAGKTTFIRCCTGLIAPDSGAVEVFGSQPGSAAALARVGLMPQHTGAWSGITPRRLLTYLASLYADPQPVATLMDLLGIGDYATTTYRHLSGGQQQAVNLAGALVGRPGLLFLDEPTAGLDPRARNTVWALVRKVRAAGVAIVLTTHNMVEATELSDVVHIIDRGQVKVSGTVHDLTRRSTLEQVYLDHTSEPAW